VKAVVFVALVLVSGCRDSGANRSDADGSIDSGLEDAPDYLARLQTSDAYAGMQGEGAEVKYLLAVRDRMPPAPLDEGCAFQNTRRFPYHVQFIQSFPELADIDSKTYVQMTLRKSSRVWWGGGLAMWPAVPHPVSKKNGIVSYTVYQAPDAGENMTVDDVVEVDSELKGCAPFANRLLAFVPDGPVQANQVRAIEATLRSMNVAVVYPEQLRTD
jgi:hypothetical protein